LGRYVPRENLVFYVQFDGLDAHADAWQKTAAYRMLNSTPLGVMLEEVAAQLLENLLSRSPDRKLTGAEVVKLVKAVTHKGWVLAVNATKDAKAPITGIAVFRGLAAKDQRSLSGRLVGLMMMGRRPQIDRKGDRVLVRPTNPDGHPTDFWWTEGDDLVLGASGAGDAGAYIAALEGKAPSAAEHPVLSEITKPSGSFVPLMAAFVDPAALPPPPAGLTEGSGYKLFDQVKNAGVKRLDYRWGFDDDGLMSVTRLIAPAPRKSFLTMFDQPKLDPKKLIPIPEGVDSFLILSISPAKVLDALAQAEPGGTAKAKIDEFLAKLKDQNRIDFEKDFLGNLGPKMALYLAPGRSAAATDETPEAAAKAGGLDPTAVLSSLSTALPKPTLVAELNDPKTFSKALDGVMIAVNKELKAMAIEKAAAEEEADRATANQPGGAPGLAGGPGRFPGRRGGAEAAGAGPGERPARKRSSKDIPVPYFQLMTGSGAAKSYRLIIPAESALKFGGPSVHPTVRMEDKYVAFSSTSEAARVAIDTIKKKGWKPPADIEQAVSRVPSDLILLAVVDPRETTPQLLASLPGTLQAQINAAIAMAASGPTAAGPGNTFPGSPPPATIGPMASGGSGALPSKPGMRMQGSGPGGSSGGPGGGSSGGFGPPAGYPGMTSGGYPGMPRPGGAGPGAPGTTPAAAMIEIKVDPSKLPKAEELKALMYPGMLAIAVDDQSIQIVSRDSFPNLVGGVAGGAVGTALLLPAIQSARRAAEEAAARAAGGAPGQQPPGAPAAGANNPAPAPGAAPAGPQGPGRRRRGGPE
jgi:hypothetical protein